MLIVNFLSVVYTVIDEYQAEAGQSLYEFTLDFWLQNYFEMGSFIGSILGGGAYILGQGIIFWGR